MLDGMSDYSRIKDRKSPLKGSPHTGLIFIESFVQSQQQFLNWKSASH